MPTRLFYDLIKQSLETNVRLAENLATFMKAAQGASERRPEPEPAPPPANNGMAPKEKTPVRPGQHWVYRFGAGTADGSAAMRDLLGGKGANLAEMSNLGLPVPPGFTISTEMCAAYNENGKQFPDGLKSEVNDALAA